MALKLAYIPPQKMPRTESEGEVMPESSCETGVQHLILESIVSKKEDNDGTIECRKEYGYVFCFTGREVAVV